LASSQALLEARAPAWAAAPAFFVSSNTHTIGVYRNKRPRRRGLRARSRIALRQAFTGRMMSLRPHSTLAGAPSGAGGAKQQGWPVENSGDDSRGARFRVSGRKSGWRASFCNRCLQFRLPACTAKAISSPVGDRNLRICVIPVLARSPRGPCRARHCLQ